MTPEIRALEPCLEAGWDAFVTRHPEGTFFHLSAWRRVLEKALGHRTHYLLAVDQAGVSGVLPLAEVQSRLFGHALISTPFCASGGAVADEAAVARMLEDAACDLAIRLGVDYLELRNRRASRPDWPTKDLYVTFRKPIAPDDEKNLAAIPRKQRAMVRKGIAASLSAVTGQDIATLYDVYSASLRNLGTPVFSRRVMEQLVLAFPQHCDTLIVRRGSDVLAGVLNFYFRDEVLPYYGGSYAASRAHAANDYMYWEVMRRAAERGCRVFDYGRSKRGTGSFSFKEHWGFVPEPLAYQYFLVKAKSMPNLSPTNPVYGRAIGLWRRLPLGLTRVVGPPIARNLG